MGLKVAGILSACVRSQTDAPTPPKSRRRTLAHTAECEAQALAVRAIAGATKRCAGRRESDEEWEAMEQLLAGRLPEPSVMDQDPPEDIMREYDTRVVTSLKALQQTLGGINNQSTGREEEGTRGGEEGTSSRGNRTPERGTEGKEGEDTRNGVGGECVYLLATEATSTT